MADALDSLKYFNNLYREMGYHEVAGYLVYLTDEPDVIRVGERMINKK